MVACAWAMASAAGTMAPRLPPPGAKKLLTGSASELFFVKAFILEIRLGAAPKRGGEVCTTRLQASILPDGREIVKWTSPRGKVVQSSLDRRSE